MAVVLRFVSISTLLTVLGATLSIGAPSQDSLQNQSREVRKLGGKSLTDLSCDHRKSAFKKAVEQNRWEDVPSFTEAWRPCTTGKQRTLSYYWAVRALFESGDYSEIPSVIDSLDQDPLASDSTVYSFTLERAGRAAFRRGDGVTAVLNLKRAVRLGRSRSPDALANTYSTLAIAANGIGDYRRAMKALNESLTLTKRTLSLKVRTQIFETRAHTRLNRAFEGSGEIDTDSLLHDIEMTEKLLRSSNESRALPGVSVLRAGFKLHVGDVKGATNSVKKALSQAEAVDDRWSKIQALFIYSRIHLAEKNPTKALNTLRLAAQAAEKEKTSSFTTWLHVLKIRAHLQKNDPARAIAIFRELRHLEAPGVEHGIQRASLSLASISTSKTNSFPWSSFVVALLALSVAALRFRRPEWGADVAEAMPAWVQNLRASVTLEGAAPAETSTAGGSSGAASGAVPESGREAGAGGTGALPSVHLSEAVLSPLSLRPPVSASVPSSASVEAAASVETASREDDEADAVSTPSRARHLGGRRTDAAPSFYSADAPHVSLPDELADADALGEIVALESAHGTAVWARLFDTDRGDGGDHHGPRMLFVRDGGGVEISHASGAIGVVVGETSREKLPLPVPATVQWAGNGHGPRCQTWGELRDALQAMADAAPRSAPLPSSFSADAVATQVADALTRSSVGHVDVRTDGETPLSTRIVDQTQSSYADREAVPVLLWHRLPDSSAYHGAAWPVVRPIPTQVFFGDFDRGVTCSSPQDLMDLFAHTLAVVSPERLALRVLERAGSVGPSGHVLVSGPGCRPVPDRWILSTVETSDAAATPGRIPVVVRSQQVEASPFSGEWN